MAYTFQIREDTVFHGGRPVTADDVLWSFERPTLYGTGPSKLKRYDVGETLLLAHNDDYYLGLPKLAEVEMILSGGTGMLMYENNEIHITRVGLADLDRLLDTNNALNAELRRVSRQFSIQYIGLNVNEPPLDGPKVRQALNLAIDKQEIATIVLGDQVVPATGILRPGFPRHDPDLKDYAFDPKRAQQLLAESKYGEDPENVPPIIMTSSGSFGAEVDLDVVMSMWKKNLGLQVVFQRTKFTIFLRNLHKNRYQMFGAGWIVDYPDPENFFDMLFFSVSSNNHINYDSPEVDLF